MNKKRISMTIAPDVLSRIDSMVDGMNIRSRSEAIESVMSQHLEGNKTAVFLGGGDIKSLMINDTFKPFLEIGSKTLIEHNIESIKKGGFRNIYVVGKSEFIGECFKLIGNGIRYGVRVDYVEESKTRGNAKTLQLAENEIKTSFLVLPIDNFFDFDLNYLSMVHMGGNSVATLAVQSSRSAKNDLGVVEMVGNSIIDYEERPRKPKTFLTATFIGIYEPGIFEYIPRGNSKWVLQTDVFPRLIRENKLQGCLVPGFYMNIDTAKDLNSVRDFVGRRK